MTDWPLVFLGLIAVGVAVIAAVQVAFAVVALRAARQASEMLESLRRDVRPLLAKVERISDEASRATRLALRQVERADELMSTSARRIDDTLAILQGAVIQPVRQGAAVVAGVRAAWSVLRAWQRRSRAVRDDDEALFVG